VSHDPLDYPFWLASRSAGVVAYLLLSGSVVLGLAMAARLTPVKARADLRVLHERLALLALGATGAHGLLLLPDGWLRPGLHELVIPFTSTYRPVWTGLGICAAYLAAGLSLTYYARGRLGARRWRNAHRLIPVAWAMAAAHVIGAGSDAVSLWLQVVLALTIAAVIMLLAQRWWLGRLNRPAPRPPAEPEPEPEPEPRPAERRYAGELGLFR
jgi:methionine sulfoxide reductase heme-binding subunit